MVNWSNMDERPDRLVPRKRKDAGYWLLWVGALIVACMFLIMAVSVSGVRL